jgi:hypothetical protein
MEIDYLKLLQKSWKGFKTNLVLLVPVAIGILLGFAWVILLVLEAVVMLVLFSDWILSDPALILSNGLGVFLGLVFLIVDLVSLLVISAYTRSMVIGMLNDIATKGKTDISKMFKHGKKFFGVYFQYILLRILIFGVPFLVLAGVVFLCYLASHVLAIIVGIFFLLAYIIYSIFIGLGLFFVEPVIALNKGSAVDVIKQSFAYSKRDVGHLLLSWLTVFALGIVIALILMVLSIPLTIMSLVSKLTGSIALEVVSNILEMAFDLFRTCVNVVVSYVVSLFVFLAYYAKKK